MKRGLLKTLFAVSFCFVFLTQINIFGITASASASYTITGYDIDMVVNEDNTYDITERINVNFKENSHGIYRKIPLKNPPDGKSNSKISNVKVNEEFSLSKENGYQIIKIGKSDEFVKGDHSYTISYKYNFGKDPLKYADVLYFNLIGEEWDTVISNVTFKITMPKDFDESLLSIFDTQIAGFKEKNVVYSVKGNEISGYLKNPLREGTALTVILQLPEGYFVGASNNVNEDAGKVMLLSGFCVLTAAVLWLVFGRESKAIDGKLRYYPPSGWNPAEVGLCYYGRVKTSGILSLVIYLAGKGYLKFRDIARVGTSASNRRFVIVKLREYDGRNECERLFLDGLFKSEESVSTICLQEGFYDTYKKVKSKLKSKEVRRLLFEPSSVNKIPFLVAMAILIYSAITAVPMLGYEKVSSIIFILLLSGAGFSVAVVWLMGKARVCIQALIAAPALLGFVPWYYRVLPCLKQDSAYIVMYIVGVVCIAIILTFVMIMPKRTEFGFQKLAEIKSFRNFLETAENSELDMLISQNPQYFYEIMPYAYALGVADKWLQKFSLFDLEYPTWYSSFASYHPSDFCYFIDSMIRSSQWAMSTYIHPLTLLRKILNIITFPVSGGDSYDGGSSGGSSGGGSGGGGFGGGGGGSW